VSKFRIEFKSSRLQVFFQLLAYAILVLSVLIWQSESIQYQYLLQASVLLLTTFFVIRSILYNWQEIQEPVILSDHGEWLETDITGQVSWKITDKSRVSSLLLFIHLISPVNARRFKWCLIYRDQLTEQDFRRLCRAVIYQQQTAGKH
jgi:hypothetical protein